ncbi:MAG: hypothetical protein EXR79_08365 [Myxococcales bacterium]|nr:hypothetical protein [Myxococcales bacterium]
MITRPIRPFRLVALALATGLVPASAFGQAPPAVDRSEIEEKRRQREELEKRKAEMQVQESAEQREARERVEKRDSNVKEALKRAQAGVAAANARQNQKGMQLFEAAWQLDPSTVDYPFNTGAFAEALNNVELEFRAMAAVQILAKRAVKDLPDTNPRKADMQVKLDKANARLDFLRAKLPTGTLQIRSEPATCELRVDGTFVGIGSGEIETMTGQRKVEASCVGYTDHELFVSVRQGDPTPAVIRPKQITYFGKLIVRVTPTDGVTTYLDDEPVEKRLADKATKEGSISGKGTREEPYELAARKWVIRFHKEGHDRWHRRIEIVRDQPIMVEARLESLSETVEGPATAPTPAAKPTGDSGKPTGDSGKPTGDSGKPTGDSGKPAGLSAKPAPK